MDVQIGLFISEMLDGQMLFRVLATTYLSPSQLESELTRLSPELEPSL